MVEGAVHSFILQDGTLLWIKPLEPYDAGHLVDLFNHMSADSRFLRFNLSLPNPEPDLVIAEARRMATIDHDKDGAWLVFADLPDQPAAAVAGARYIRIAEDTAEASLAVRDDMQRRGIGAELLRFLAQAARMAGVRFLVASAQRGNRPLWRLLSKSTLAMEMESEGGYTDIKVDLGDLDTKTLPLLNGSP